MAVYHQLPDRLLLHGYRRGSDYRRELYLFVGIDCTSKFAVTQLIDKVDKRTAREFLEHLLKAVSYRIHTILTHNSVLSEVEGGIQFAERPFRFIVDPIHQMPGLKI
jgi:hypothetical protein